MKKLYFTLIALFMLFAAQAQTITETDLLGEWQPQYFTIKGCTYDFKTDNLTVPDYILEKEKKKGRNINDMKAEFRDAIKSTGFDYLTIVFKPESMLEWRKGDNVSIFKYSVITKEGINYLAGPDGRPGPKFDYKDGHFKLLGDGSKGAEMEVVFEKIK